MNFVFLTYLRSSFKFQKYLSFQNLTCYPTGYLILQFACYSFTVDIHNTSTNWYDIYLLLLESDSFTTDRIISLLLLHFSIPSH